MITLVQNQILAAKAETPAVTPVQPLAGNITQQDDKSFPEATALAYNVCADAKLIYNRIDAAIASPVHQNKNITLVIYDQASLNGVQQYLAFKPQLALQRLEPLLSCSGCQDWAVFEIYSSPRSGRG